MNRENISIIRKSKGLSRSSLARLAQISPVTLWKIEKGKSDVTVNTIERIASALDVDVRLFFGGTINFSYHLENQEPKDSNL
jgi:transcriptional regulator with XRE-family HTH domain